MLREVRPHHRAIVLAVRCTDAEDGNSMDTAKLCKGLYGDFDSTTGAVQCIPGCNVGCAQGVCQSELYPGDLSHRLMRLLG